MGNMGRNGEDRDKQSELGIWSSKMDQRKVRTRNRKSDRNETRILEMRMGRRGSKGQSSGMCNTSY